MNARRMLMAASLTAFLIAPMTGASAADTAKGGPAHKVVFQVSDADPAKWNLALNNAKNVQQDLGAENVKVEIVAYGPGIGMLQGDSVVGNRISEALGTGVVVVACENTMKAKKLAQSDMLPKIGYVSAGVVELMERQKEGYSYIRP